MVTRNTKKRRNLKNKTKRKFPTSFSFIRLLCVLGLLLFLGFSVCTVGYVIFFRTVFAQEILPAIRESIVYEEPNPPVQDVELIEPNPVREHILPKVAIVIDDLGYNEQLGIRFVEFPLELTYSFLPHATFTGKLEEMAFDSGKTVILHLPLEPKSKKWDPGPGTMYLSDSSEVKSEKLQQSLAEVPHAVGINNHMGSLYTSDLEAMRHLMVLLQGRGLFFIDSFTASNSKGLQAAKESGIMTARRNVFLDNDLEVEKICNQIDRLVHVAEKQGMAIGIGHPHSETLTALTNCTEIYKDRIEFVGVAEILN